MIILIMIIRVLIKLTINIIGAATSVAAAAAHAAAAFVAATTAHPGLAAFCKATS